jgi:two-component system sensor histidine kinase MprB
VDLATVAAAAVERFRARSERQVTVRSEPTGVAGDPDALRRAVSNLLSNADKYIPGDRPIEVEVEDGGVWVSDHGGGIPAEDRARVFDRFYRRQDDRAQPGSGLGLSIVASIVGAHGGTVEVDDADGGGARVGFRLPTAGGE